MSKSIKTDNVPPKFQFLIPLATRWGISDAVERDVLIEKASRSELTELVSVMDEYDEVLDEWLANSDIQMGEITFEYVAFSCMRLAGDTARMKLQKLEGR